MIDWDATVSIKDVEAAYCEFNELALSSFRSAADDDVGNQQQRRKALDAWMQKRKGNASASSPSGDCEVDLDEFRIGRSGGGIRDESSQDTSAAGVRTSLSLLRSFLDNVVVIFPSAFEHVSGNPFDEAFPCVSVDPLFLGQSGGEDLFLAVDGMVRRVRNAPFLCDDVEKLFSEEVGGTSTSLTSAWLEPLVRNSRWMSDDPSEIRIPLYALLMARFEFAVFESYRERSLRPSVSTDVSPVDDEKALSKVEGDSTSIRAASSRDNKPGVTGKDPVSRTSSLAAMIRDVGELVVRLQGRSDTFDSERLGEIWSPFAEACVAGDGSGPRMRGVRDLLFTPFSLLARVAHPMKFDFDTLDYALGGSLKRMASIQVNETDRRSLYEDGSCPSNADSEGSNGESVAAKTIEPNTTDAPLAMDGVDGEQTQLVSQTKKKKNKKKRRKVSVISPCRFWDVNKTHLMFRFPFIPTG